MSLNQIAQAIMGAGSVRLDIYNPDTQTWSGWGDPVGADKFGLTPQSEIRRKNSKRRENYGQNVASVVIGQPTQIAITISAMDRQSLAAQFQGKVESWTAGSGTLTDVAVTAKLDKWLPIGNHRNLVAAGLTVTNEAESTTYVLGTDYEINYWRGEIKALSSGAITADQALKVSGTKTAIDGTLIKGGARPQVRVRALFDGVNMVDDKNMECEVWEAVLTSSNEFDFLADDFNGIELTGECVVPAGKDSPYEVRLKN